MKPSVYHTLAPWAEYCQFMRRQYFLYPYRHLRTMGPKP